MQKSLPKYICYLYSNTLFLWFISLHYKTIKWENVAYMLTVVKTRDISLLNVSITTGFQPLLNIIDTNILCNGNNIHSTSHTLCQPSAVFLSYSNIHMALFTWKNDKIAKYMLQDYTSEGSITSTGLSAYVWVMWEWCSSISQTYFLQRSCWCFLGATGTRPIQPASPWKGTPTDSPAFCTSPCHHKQKVFLKGHIRQEMAGPTLAQASLSSGSTWHYKKSKKINLLIWVGFGWLPSRRTSPVDVEDEQMTHWAGSSNI